ncbi:MAG: YdcF family protein [Pseudomonadota bacterium]
MLRILRWFLRLGVLGFATTLLAVIWAEQRALARHLPQSAPGLPVDAVIVLGGGMDPDQQLNHVGRERVRTALALLKAGQTRAIIFTGNLRDEPDLSEAELMHGFARSLGADPARLYVEPRALTTLQNLRFAFPIAARAGFARLALVTDAFHLTRAGQLAALLGRADVVLVASPGLTRARTATRIALILRETLAWPYNLIKAAGWTGLGWLGWTEEDRGTLIVRAFGMDATPST